MKLKMALQAIAPIKIFLCGDVMTGRGVDQILPHPVAPHIYEGFMQSSIDYVRLAERAHGSTIPKPVNYSYIWGEALHEFEQERPDLRIINLETTMTTSEDYDPKGINYRMSPENGGVLLAAGIDCCELANNHMLDWGLDGLLETLNTLDRLNIKRVGAGRNLQEAWAPAFLDVEGKGRVVLFALGSGTSGVPRKWSATDAFPGVAYFSDVSDRTAITKLKHDISHIRRPNDIVIVSIHYGSNWGYNVSESFRDFAHQLIDESNISILHVHSSHHPKGIELYNNRLILYGCGDFINDYEGIRGYEMYRDDLTFMYFVEINPSNGDISAVTLTPLKIHRFQLVRPSVTDVHWLRGTLDQESRVFGTAVVSRPDGRFTVQSAKHV